MQDAGVSQEGEAYLYEFSMMQDRWRLYHLFAHFVRDGIWIDVHLVKILTDKEKDRQLFLDFVKGVRFVPISDMQARPLDEWPNAQEAFERIRARAEKGDAFAQLVMGTGYLFGSRSTARDHVAARFWFRKAADQGDRQAQRFLGMMLEKGWGGTQDLPEALTWYRKAAEQGEANAQYSLGLMYAEGRGLPQDSVRAYMWISLAAPSLTDDAKKEGNDILAKLAKRMTAAQLKQAHAMAQACRAESYKHCDQ
jgi:TPR repeat protein